MAAQQSTPTPSSHYVSQAGLATALAGAIRAHWPNLSRVELFALLTRFSHASATIAARDYVERRAASGVGSQFTVPHASPPTAEHFSKTLDWVYADPKAAEDRMVAAMTRLAVQGGRETTVEAVQRDRQARGWARETRGGCCYFCAMLATRGAIYKSDQTAGRSANEKFVGAGEFKFHNNCHCIAVPVFGVYEKTADARAWTRQWHDMGRERGYSPSLLQWRQHFEGRTKDVPQSAGSN